MASKMYGLTTRLQLLIFCKQLVDLWPNRWSACQRHNISTTVIDSRNKQKTTGKSLLQTGLTTFIKIYEH